MSYIGDLLILAPCFFIVLSLYELGRFIAAKLSGAPVLELSFGYRGHRAFSFMLGETRYSISKFPMVVDAAIVRGRNEDNTPRIEGCFMYEFAARVLGHEESEIDSLSLEMERAESILKKREIEDKNPEPAHFLMLLSGTLCIVMCMWVFHFVALYAYIPFLGPTKELRVGSIIVRGVADEAGLKVGDVIDSVNGTKVSTWDAVAESLIRAKGQSELVLTRANEEGKNETVTLSIPSVSVSDRHVGLAYGFRPAMGRKDISAKEAFTNATPVLLAVPVWIAASIVGPHEAQAQSMFSAEPWCPHVVQEESAQWRFGFISTVGLLWYVAIFMNLLPFPWADGYRLMKHVKSRLRTGRDMAVEVALKS